MGLRVGDIVRFKIEADEVGDYTIHRIYNLDLPDDLTVHGSTSIHGENEGVVIAILPQNNYVIRFKTKKTQDNPLGYTQIGFYGEFLELKRRKHSYIPQWIIEDNKMILK